jgi:small subunit ribosomal protein S8
MANVCGLLAELRNGSNAHKSMICVKPSKDSLNLLSILKDYGLIQAISPIENRRVKVYLKYNKEACAFFSIGRVSRPSLPVYFKAKDLWKFHKSYGILVLQTGRGIICHHTALKRKLGGQLVCYIL